MKSRKKIATITIDIPYRRAGNIIHQQSVSFELYGNSDNYIAVPLLNSDELRVANLPAEILFQYSGGHCLSPRGKDEGNMHVIKAIAQKLSELHLLSK